MEDGGVEKRKKERKKKEDRERAFSLLNGTIMHLLLFLEKKWQTNLSIFMLAFTHENFIGILIHENSIWMILGVWVFFSRSCLLRMFVYKCGEHFDYVTFVWKQMNACVVWMFLFRTFYLINCLHSFN